MRSTTASSTAVHNVPEDIVKILFRLVFVFVCVSGRGGAVVVQVPAQHAHRSIHPSLSHLSLSQTHTEWIRVCSSGFGLHPRLSSNLFPLLDWFSWFTLMTFIRWRTHRDVQPPLPFFPSIFFSKPFDYYFEPKQQLKRCKSAHGV